MAYTSGLLKHRVTILNRREAQQGRFGLDSAGVEFEPAGEVWASVDWAKGKGAMNAGALDVYGVVMIRMRYNTIANPPYLSPLAMGASYSPSAASPGIGFGTCCRIAE